MLERGGQSQREENQRDRLVWDVHLEFQTASHRSLAASIKPTFACRDGFPIGLPRADGAAGGRSAIDKVEAVVAADLHGIHRLALGRGRGFPVGYRKGGALSRCCEWE